MEKTALQAYYDDTKQSLMDNISALRSLVKQAKALSTAVHSLKDNPAIDQTVVQSVEDALKALFVSIDEMADKVNDLFDNYQKLSEQLFPE